MYKTWIAALYLAVCLLAQPGVAGPDKDAGTSDERGGYESALRFWRPLAEQGNPEAQYYLWTMYASGQVVPQDYAEAAKWTKLAAEQGYAQAQSDLGDLYKVGRGLPQDFAEAAKWYRLAANQGVTYAQYLLGFMYKNGYGVPKDYVQAHQWVNLAYASGHATAKELKDVLSKLMTPAEIAEAQRLAREWQAAHLKK